MRNIAEPGPENFFLAHHIRILRENLRRLTGRDLIEPRLSDREAAEYLYQAPFVLLSHDAEADPVFNYANRSGQQLFELTWAEMTNLLSRYSAETVNRAERERLLRKVSAQGYIDDYCSVRIAKSGRRFRISNATVWNLCGADGRFLGHAAKFDQWEYLDEKNT